MNSFEIIVFNGILNIIGKDTEFVDIFCDYIMGRIGWSVAFIDDVIKLIDGAKYLGEDIDKRRWLDLKVFLEMQRSDR